MKNQPPEEPEESPSDPEGVAPATTRQDDTAPERAPRSNADQAVENQKRALESGEENPS